MLRCPGYKHFRLACLASTCLTLTCLVSTLLWSPAALAQNQPQGKEPKTPAFVVSPALDTFEPGDTITLSYTKGKLPKGLKVLLGDQVLATTAGKTAGEEAVEVTIPTLLTDGTYTLRVTVGAAGAVGAIDEAEPKTIFTRSITIQVPERPIANGKIAFSTMGRMKGAVFIMDADGSNQTQLTDEASFYGYRPRFSSDGSKLTFRATLPGHGLSADVVVMNADGREQKNLTNTPTTNNDMMPVLSPDGTKVAFHSVRGAYSNIYIMNVDGTGETNLTQAKGLDRDPEFSPDGSQITFESDRADTSKIYIINLDGTGEANLTDDAAMEFSPIFSPDGSKIAYTSHRDGSGEIYIIDKSDGTPKRLTYTKAKNRKPVFSPDSRKIAFQSNRDGNSEIYIINVDGTGEMNLTNAVGDDTSPVFSPDGRKIAFVAMRHGSGEIYSMNLDGSDQTNLTRTPTIHEDVPDWAPSVTERNPLSSPGSR
jgi:Tol biopolymer transport system component